MIILDVASAFVIKWNLSFNFNKSKVLVVGKRVNRSKQWKLGSDLIEEVNEYKYLASILTKSFIRTENRVGDKTQPCFSPFS
jgi:hypothetical protein